MTYRNWGPIHLHSGAEPAHWRHSLTQLEVLLSGPPNCLWLRAAQVRCGRTLGAEVRLGSLNISPKSWALMSTKAGESGLLGPGRDLHFPLSGLGTEAMGCRSTSSLQKSFLVTPQRPRNLASLLFPPQSPGLSVIPTSRTQKRGRTSHLTLNRGQWR